MNSKPAQERMLNIITLTFLVFKKGFLCFFIKGVRNKRLPYFREGKNAKSTWKDAQLQQPSRKCN